MKHSASEDMDWYSGLIYLESTSDPEAEKEPLWEELLFLVKASDYEDAEEKLKAIGESKADEYIAAADNVVRWRFDCVDRIERLDDEELEPAGTEVFARFLRPSEVESLRKPFDDDEEDHKHQHERPTI